MLEPKKSKQTTQKKLKELHERTHTDQNSQLPHERLQQRCCYSQPIQKLSQLKNSLLPSIPT